MQFYRLFRDTSQKYHSRYDIKNMHFSSYFVPMGPKIFLFSELDILIASNKFIWELMELNRTNVSAMTSLSKALQRLRIFAGTHSNS